MKKALNVHQFGDSNPIVRAYSTGKDYNPDTMFLGHEVSNLLEALLPAYTTWMDFVTDNPELLKEKIEKGYEHNGRMYHAFMAYFKGTWGRAMMIDEQTLFGLNLGNPFELLPAIGVHVEFNRTSEFIKAPKALNRLFAPCQDLVMGKLVELDEDSDERRAIYELGNGELFAIRHISLDTLDIEQKGAVDGGAAISVDGVRKLTGKPGHLGWARRFTSVDGIELGKWHLQCTPQLEEYDLVIYGGKPYIKTDFFAFSDMGELHPGDMFTDIQSFVNFDWYKDHLGPQLVRDYLEELRHAMRDEWHLRRLVLSQVNAEQQDADGIDLINPEGFLLQHAISRGLSPKRFPGLKRRAYRYLTSNIMDLKRLRIPMSVGKKTIGQRYYVTFDPFIVQANGDIDMTKSNIPEGQVMCPGLPGGTTVAVYRNPNGHPGEMDILETYQSDRYRKFKRSGLCLTGRYSYTTHEKLNGGDNDDSWNIISDPAWVETMMDLPEYPVKGLHLDVKTADRKVAEHERVYGKRHVYLQIDDAAQKKIGIGPAVNVCIDDVVKHHPVHKQVMIMDLRERKEDMFADWLEYERPFQMAAKEAANLENIIDGKLILTTEIADYHKAQFVYPEFYTTSAKPRRLVNGGTRISRIPDSKIKDGGFVLAKTAIDIALDGIKSQVDTLLLEATESEWLEVSPADHEIKDYFPSDPEIKKVVHGFTTANNTYVPGLIQTWNRAWMDVFAEGKADADRRVAYNRIEKLIREELDGFDQETRKEVAIEVYRSVYTTYFTESRKDKDGRPRNYPDGLLWTRPLGFAFISALESAGFTGRIVRVDVAAGFRHECKGAVLIEGKDGVVYRKTDGAALGLCPVLPNGNYLMDHGLVDFKPAHEGLLPEEGE